jgi:predicted nucleic acid-binding protein
LDCGWPFVKAVVDTDVVAYFLLGTEPFAAEAHRFLSAVSHPLAPALWEAEIANVLWMAVRTEVLPPDEGSARLGLAARLGIESVPTRPLLQAALLRSVTTHVAVYDTLFVELAIREACPLATFDRAVLKAFPKVAVRPSVLVPE